MLQHFLREIPFADKFWYPQLLRQWDLEAVNSIGGIIQRNGLFILFHTDHIDSLP